MGWVPTLPLPVLTKEASTVTSEAGMAKANSPLPRLVRPRRLPRLSVTMSLSST